MKRHHHALCVLLILVLAGCGDTTESVAPVPDTASGGTPIVDMIIDAMVDVDEDTTEDTTDVVEDVDDDDTDDLSMDTVSVDVEDTPDMSSPDITDTMDDVDTMDAVEMSDMEDMGMVEPPFVPPARILFIGNSFTFQGPVPTIVDQLANDAG